MKKIGFLNDKYIELEKKGILERKEKFEGKLYLEVGGKLLDDLHAKRVLPGFIPDNKIRILESLKNEIEVIVTVGQKAIESNKVRQDKGLTYSDETFNIINSLEKRGILINSIVINQYEKTPNTDKFISEAKNKGIKIYTHKKISGYPYDVDYVVSEEGLGQNEYIETKRDIVLVIGPGPSSGKMSTCLSQLYLDSKKGIKSGYAKLELFPIWNLPVEHMVNIAYEAATADLEDKVMIDPMYLSKYNKIATSYNRDVELFPILDTLLTKIYGERIYNSPTDMGVNYAGDCISSDEIVIKASKIEIIRRYLKAVYEEKYENGDTNQPQLLKRLLNKAQIDIFEDEVVAKVDKEKSINNNDNCLILLENGEEFVGIEQDNISAFAICILNVLENKLNLEKDTLFCSKMIENILKYKKQTEDIESQKIEAVDCILAFAILQDKNEIYKKAIQELPIFKYARLHSSKVISKSDIQLAKKLKIDSTFIC
ncbi:MAG: DUF1846 domain-containing protein [Clostridium sp.]